MRKKVTRHHLDFFRTRIVTAFALLLSTTVASATTKFKPLSTGCSWAQNPPCPLVLNPQAAGPAGSAVATPDTHVEAFCRTLDTNDHACFINVGSLILLSVAAGTCATSCMASSATLTLGSPITDPTCAFFSHLATGYEAISQLTLASKTEEHKTSLEKGFKRNYALTPPMAAAVAASSLAGLQIAGQIAIATQTSASNLQSLGNPLQFNYSCTAATILTALLSVKIYDQVQIGVNNETNFDGLCSLSNACAPAAPTTTLAGIQSPTVGGSSGGLGAATNPTGASIPEVAGAVAPEAKSADAAVQNGQVAQAAASADFKPFLGPNNAKDVDKKITDFLKSQNIKPSQLVDSLLRNGVGETLGKFVGSDAKARDFAKNLGNSVDKEMRRQQQLLGADISFAAQNVRNQNRGPANSFRPSFGNKTAAAGPVVRDDSFKFGGVSGDIWHAGSAKSLFEIVSDRTRAVTPDL